MNRYARVYAEIDGTALKENIRNIRKKTPREVFVMPVIKADAYGHGAGFAAVFPAATLLITIVLSAGLSVLTVCGFLR